MVRTLSAIALLCSFSFSTFAQVTVDQMTCAQAQHYTKKHKRYYKDGGPDGAIPIYPVYSLEDVNCGGRTNTSAQMERTLDVADCIVGWYCRSY